MDAWRAAKNALKCVLEAKKGESLVIVCDDERMGVGEAFAKGASELALQTRLIRLRTGPSIFRKEVSPQLMEILTEKTSEIYINLLRGIREETPFRIQLIKIETKTQKTRLGHCPGVTLDMLTNGALALVAKEHQQMQAFAYRLMEKLSQVVRVEIENPAGTNVSLNVEGRPFFTDTKIDWEKMKWMNLPTGEVIVAPLESSLEGKLACDMAIGGIGPIKAAVEIKAKTGKAQTVHSADTQVLKRVEDSLNTDDWSNVVGEFAFGINPKARFVEEFLEAEKMLGTIHIAFGNNSDMPGGRNRSKNHMDFLVSKPTVRVLNKDGSSVTVLENGTFQYL